MAQTANYGFEKPSTDNNVDEEFYQLQETLDLLDAILAALQTAVNGKSAVGHTHAISDIVNLAAELAAKMPASATFKLDDLTDVSGADGAPNGYVLVKSALGWLPSSALAALGTHGHLISEITGLVDALAGKADAAATTSALAGKADATATTAALATKAPLDLSGLTAKTTPVDADLVGLGDSAASFGLKKLTFANLWAWVSGKVLALFNASGSAPVYACRAWVNFNGTGTVAIRGSGNVSSITDNGTGSYTVNFTTALSDANYAAMMTTTFSGGPYIIGHNTVSPQTASACSITTGTTGGITTDVSVITFAAFR